MLLSSHLHILYTIPLLLQSSMINSHTTSTMPTRPLHMSPPHTRCIVLLPPHCTLHCKYTPSTPSSHSMPLSSRLHIPYTLRSQTPPCSSRPHTLHSCLQPARYIPHCTLSLCLLSCLGLMSS